MALTTQPLLSPALEARRLAQDLARRRTGAGPALTEPALFRALRMPATTQRTCPCACGGSITADPTNADDVLDAVRVHRETPGHRVWTDMGRPGL